MLDRATGQHAGGPGADHAGAEVDIRADPEELGAPIVCNDGLTTAKEFSLKDPEENLGAQMLRRGLSLSSEYLRPSDFRIAALRRLIAGPGA